MCTESERPQGREDVLTLIARLRLIERTMPEQAAACRHLLSKLLPYDGEARAGSAAPSR